ncbi:MAG: redoxin family protein [Opitutales bacterium]|nr:redoxin family protein [Opitutales bacterium]
MKKFFLILALLCSPVFALAAPDAPAPQKEKQTPENWKKLFGRDLFDADGKKVAVSKAIKKKYVAIYSSASWCGPCRAFTPKLIEFYKKNKDKIDVILIGSHHTKEDVCKYMKKYEMPWPGTYITESTKDFFARHRIEGIPDLRVFKQNGELVINDGYDLNVVQKLLDGKQ